MDRVCEKFSAERFFRESCQGSVPEALKKLWLDMGTEQGRDLFCVLNGIGALEPLSFTRPGAGEIVQVYDKSFTAPAATFGPDGVTIRPSDVKLISLCAPEGKVLVVKILRATPGDLTASQHGEVVMKRMAVVGFSEGFCPAGEPGDGDEDGTFQNIEHIILPSKAGFDVYGRNNWPYGPATFKLHGEMWESC